MRLIKIANRQEYVSNNEKPRPASWVVDGTSIRIIGHSGRSFSFYSVHVGGDFHPLFGIKNSEMKATDLSFKDAKIIARKIISAKEQS